MKPFVKLHKIVEVLLRAELDRFPSAMVGVINSQEKKMPRYFMTSSYYFFSISYD